MDVPSHFLEFWSRFAAARGQAPVGPFYEAFSFGDTPAMTDEFANLVLSGRKRATAGSLWALQARGVQPPRAGDLSIVTNAVGKPLCVIQTTTTFTVPFNEVSADFAAAEGEGDGSLAYWREGHTAFFNRECARIGREFSTAMPIICEHFTVVYSEATSAA
jgi:uncharacterized protein YhfF